MDQNVALYSVRPSRAKPAPGIAAFSYLSQFHFAEENKRHVRERKVCDNVYIPLLETGTAVAQWLRCCATNRKVACSILDGVMEFFIDIILPIALWP